MGCVHSRVEREETVRRCRERRRLMKQLLSCRAELAAAHMSYLQSLRNTGATLRQFTEVEPIVPCNDPPGLTLPPSPPPPPPLPPSPPPPPHYSPGTKDSDEEGEDSSIDMDDDESDNCTPPPPPMHNSAWGLWDPFDPLDSSNTSSAVAAKKAKGVAPQAALEEEDWAETNTEFAEEEEEEMEKKKEEVDVGSMKLLVNPVMELDDNSSVVSRLTKDTDTAAIVWRSKKTLVGIVKELDDYFLKAAAGGKDVAGILESNNDHHFQWNFDKSKAKNSKSAKVVNALSWSRSFRSPQSNRDGNIQDTGGDACRPGSHCNTLEKIYTEEQRLCKEVKEEEIAKFQHKKKTLVLQKLETTDHDQIRIEKIRSNIDYLQSRIISLQESISETCLLISKHRDEDLYPQLVELSSGLSQMWRTMYECHQVQNHIALQANLIDKHPGTEPTSEAHRHATIQLETEVNSWYTSFCNLVRSQHEYVRVLNQWVRLTDCLPETNELPGSSGIHALCEEWQLALDRLPDKVAAEAIKSLVSVVHSIVLQQTEEHNLQKKSERLESKLERELNSFHELENMIEDPSQATNFNHQSSSTKHAKLEALKKRAEEEKAKYQNSVRISRAMTLNNLQTSLPNVFQALMGFANVCVQAFEGINQPTVATTGNLESISAL